MVHTVPGMDIGAQENWVPMICGMGGTFGLRMHGTFLLVLGPTHVNQSSLTLFDLIRLFCDTRGTPNFCADCECECGQVDRLFG